MKSNNGHCMPCPRRNPSVNACIHAKTCLTGAKHKEVHVNDIYDACDVVNEPGCSTNKCAHIQRRHEKQATCIRKHMKTRGADNKLNRV